MVVDAANLLSLVLFSSGVSQPKPLEAIDSPFAYILFGAEGSPAPRSFGKACIYGDQRTSLQISAESQRQDVTVAHPARDDTRIAMPTSSILDIRRLSLVVTARPI